MSTQIYHQVLTDTRTEEDPVTTTPEDDAAEDIREAAASEALLTGAPTAEEIAHWCETVAEPADSEITREAVALVTGKPNPGVLLGAAAELWLSNPGPLSLQDLDELEYLDAVIAVQAAWNLPADVHRATVQLQEGLLSRWKTKAEAATDVLDNVLGEQWLATAQIADRHRLTDEDCEQIDRDATGGNGVSIVETADGWYLVVDCTI